MQLIIVIPTYNEAENLPKLVSALFLLPVEELSLIVVDDNSPDGTGRIAEGLAESNPDRLSVIHRVGKQGLGTAYLTGFQRALDAGGEVIAQMDADFSHPPQKLLSLLEALESCDLALGSRYVKGGGVDRHWPYWRKSLSAFGNFYARTILHLPIKDATGGFKVWRRKTLLGMPLDRVRSNGYAFQIEMNYMAYRLGYAIEEVPFYFPDRDSGSSKMSFQIQWEASHRVWQLLYEYRDLGRT